MFIDILEEKNPKLIQTALSLHTNGTIMPDSYIIDVDIFKENAELIKAESDKHNINLYYMTKQIGRNPYLAKMLEDIGYSGAVAVDFKETEIMMKNNIKLGNTGHLVQIPSKMISKVLEYGTKIMTVYSYEKAYEISKEAEKLGIIQDIMFRVLDEKSNIYPGQEAGIDIHNLEDIVKKILTLKNVKINGLTSFPCFLYNEDAKTIEKTENIEVILKAYNILKEKFNITVKELNLPSSTCIENIKMIKENHGTHGEPGHALTGTTPFHVNKHAIEKPAYIYVSEISHNFREKSYFYGGGYYRRSHMENVLVGSSYENLKKVKTEHFDPNNIDYYLGLSQKQKIGDTVLGCFRTQFFVTRSNIILVKGIQSDNPEIIGRYTALGERTEV